MALRRKLHITAFCSSYFQYELSTPALHSVDSCS